MNFLEERKGKEIPLATKRRLSIYKKKWHENSRLCQVFVTEMVTLINDIAKRATLFGRINR